MQALQFVQLNLKLLIGVIDISERVEAQEKLRAVQAEFAHAARLSTLGELAASIREHGILQPLVKPKGTGVACPACKEGELVERKSRFGLFYPCNQKAKCKYAVWDPPVAEACPKCAHPVTVEKTSKRDGTYRKCPLKECGWSTLPAKAPKSSFAR